MTVVDLLRRLRSFCGDLFILTVASVYAIAAKKFYDAENTEYVLKKYSFLLTS